FRELQSAHGHQQSQSLVPYIFSSLPVDQGSSYKLRLRNSNDGTAATEEILLPKNEMPRYCESSVDSNLLLVSTFVTESEARHLLLIRQKQTGKYLVDTTLDILSFDPYDGIILARSLRPGDNPRKLLLGFWKEGDFITVPLPIPEQ